MHSRKMRAGAVLGVGALAVLTACDTDRGETESDGIIEVMGWGGTTWNQNFNTFSPATSTVTPGSSFVYEPLVRVDRVNAGEVLPYLAEDWEFNEDGTELTFNLREDVNFSDGEPMTAEDVEFTWNLVLGGETNQDYPFSAVEAVDEHTVTVFYDSPAYTDLVGFATRMIVPAHEWEDEDPGEWTNPEPVGTGPFVLDDFSPQQVSLALRDDYWGEESQGVETIRIRAMSVDAGQDALLNGELDFTTMGWENGEEEFVEQNPETNTYNFYPVGGADGIFFNTLEEPYDDAAVRRALRDSLDLQAAADVVRVGYDIPTLAGLDAIVYEDLLADDQTHEQDVDGALQELEDAGYTVEGGQLVDPDGESHSLTLDTYQVYNEWNVTAQIISDQWNENLGLNVQVNELGEQQYADAVDAGNYEMLSGVPSTGSNIYQMLRYYSSDLVGEPGDNTLGNNSFFTHDEIDEIVDELVSVEPDDQESTRELAIRGQEILTEEAPFIATATSGWKATLYEGNWTNFPVPGETDHAPNNTLPADAILTMLNLTPQEQ